MSLKITEYVIKENYENNNIYSEIKLTRDLTELFDIKKRYREFLSKANESKKFITNINNSHDNSIEVIKKFFMVSGLFIVQIYKLYL